VGAGPKKWGDADVHPSGGGGKSQETGAVLKQKRKGESLRGCPHQGETFNQPGEPPIEEWKYIGVTQSLSKITRKSKRYWPSRRVPRKPTWRTSQTDREKKKGTGPENENLGKVRKSAKPLRPKGVKRDERKSQGERRRSLEKACSDSSGFLSRRHGLRGKKKGMSSGETESEVLETPGTLPPEEKDNHKTRKRSNTEGRRARASSEEAKKKKRYGRVQEAKRKTWAARPHGREPLSEKGGKMNKGDLIELGVASGKGARN